MERIIIYASSVILWGVIHGQMVGRATSSMSNSDSDLFPHQHRKPADKLRDLEKKTGQPKAYFFVGIVGVILSAIYAMGGMKLMTDLFGFAYPAYMSFKAIESSETIDDTQWLTYWVVFGFFSIAENIMSFLIEWIPFYYMIKCAFFLWLYHPKFLGAALMYKQLIK
jgi:receptor expression-enhancing protein 5/6